MTQLEFVATQTCSIPDPFFSGGDVAMTVCRLQGENDQTSNPRQGDPALAVLPQTQEGDPVFYLTLDIGQDDNEIARFDFPEPDNRISGFAYNPITKDILAVQNEQSFTSPTNVTTTHTVISFDPGTMNETFRFDVDTTPSFFDYRGMATNGFAMAFTQGDRIVLRTNVGELLSITGEEEGVEREFLIGS